MATLRENLTASRILTLHLVGSAPLQGGMRQDSDWTKDGEKYASRQVTKYPALILNLSFSDFVFRVISAPHKHTASHDACNHSVNLPLECTLAGQRQREKADR